MLAPHTILLMPRNASSWFNSIGKKLSVEAGLAIYGQVRTSCFWIVHECNFYIDKIDFSSCTYLDGWFSRPGYIYVCLATYFKLGIINSFNVLNDKKIKNLKGSRDRRDSL